MMGAGLIGTKNGAVAGAGRVPGEATTGDVGVEVVTGPGAAATGGGEGTLGLGAAGFGAGGGGGRMERRTSGAMKRASAPSAETSLEPSAAITVTTQISPTRSKKDSV